MNFQLRDCELGAIVNRDLSRRIRTVTVLTNHKQIIRHDMKLGAKIIHNLDAKADLWQDDKPSEQVNIERCHKNVRYAYFLKYAVICF